MLRVLVLTDIVADFDMLVRELVRAGFDPIAHRASTEAAYLAELESPLDLILADNALQEFDAMRALQILRTHELDIPLIVITEASGEEAAIECMSLGADDFVFKERPARLRSALVRALDQRELRAHARAADEALRQSAAINQAVLDSLTAHIAVLNACGEIVAVNQAWERFAFANGDPGLLHTGVGINYLDICRMTAGENSAEAQQVTQGITAVLARTLDQFILEYACHSPTEERWFIMRVTPLAGEHAGAVVAHENVTARTKAAAALRASEERFRATFEQAAAGIAHIAPSGEFLRVNKRVCDIFGYTQEELLARTINDLNAPDLVAHTQAGARRLLTHNLPSYSTEVSFIHKNSSLAWINITVSLVCDDDGAPSYFIALIEDITERRKADTTRALLAAIVDSSDDAIIGVAPNGTVMSWNTGAEHLFGYRADQMLDQPIAVLRPSHLQDDVMQIYDRIARGGSTAHIETIRVRSDGSLIDVALTISAINNAGGGISGFSTIARDISARKQADHALRQTSAFVRMLQEVAVAANQATSLEQALQTAISKICEHIGWPVGHVYTPDPDEPSALLPTHIWHLEDPQRFDTFRKITEVVRLGPGIGLPGQVMSGRKSVWVSDMNLDLSTPRTRLIRDIGVRASFALPVLLGDEVAAVLEFFSTEAIEPDEALLDVLHHVGTQLGRVVERARSEAALRVSEERFRVLFAHSPDAIILIDPHDAGVLWPIVECNDVACAINGYTRAELIGQSVDLLNGVAGGRDERAAYIERLRREGSIQFETLHRRKDGTFFPIEVVSSLISVAGRELVLGIDRDISERKRAEAALQAAEAQYRTLVEQLPAIIYTSEINTQSSTTYVSPQIEAILGFSPEEWIANPGLWLERVHPDDRVRILETIGRVQASDVPIPTEYRSLTRDGRVVWLHDMERVVRDETGQPLFVQGIMLDITSRKQAEQRSVAFAALGRQLASATTAKAAARVIADAADDLVGWDAFVLQLYSAETNSVQRILSYDLVDGRRIELPSPPPGPPSSMAQRVFTAGPQLLLHGDRSFGNVELVPFGDAERRSESLMFVPIHAGATTIGLLSIQSYTPQAYTAEDLDTLQSLADHCSGALERIRVGESLHASERLYRTLSSNFPNGAVVLFDHDLRFTIADGAGLSAFGLTREDMEGRTIWEISAPALSTDAEDDYRAALAGMPHVREITLGDHAYVVHTLPVRDERGEIIAGMLMSQDITERKRIEEALIDERALLARRVDERTADLSAANAELARAAILKDEFLASMSHELRTPLNAVLGLSEALQEDVYGSLNDRQRRSLNSITESGRHLLDLINDILDLAKIGAGKLELDLEPTALTMICQASLRLIKQIAHAKQLSVAVEIDPAVTMLNVDARRVKQILVNLLSNAVKFTPEGGSIGLEVVGDVARQAVDLTVWDTGIGIAQEQMPRLFQPFVQLDSRLARQYEGTGLGLALVYRMVELHGGSIAVTSEVGYGSRFTVALPWLTADSVADGSAYASKDLVASAFPPVRHALVVEDSPTTAEQIARYLHELAISSEIVRDSAEAVTLAFSAPPDVIILDLLLAKSSGWDVLARLKAEPRTRAIPVVVISAIDERERGLALGAAEYLIKPVARADFQRVLAQLVPTSHGARVVPAADLSSRTASGIAQPLVLLAEDNEATITMITDYLNTCGYQVVVARNGAEAITRARESHPALVVMDIQMPGMDGIEATRRIRTIPDLSGLPIIALTALAMPGDHARCLAAGASDYLSKPVSLKVLALLIDKHIQPHTSSQRNPR